MPVIIKKHVIENKIILNKNIDRVFSFFNQIENLYQITPAWLKFRLLSPDPVSLDLGVFINFSFKLNGIPIRCKTEISEWNPPDCFELRQNEGPFLLWIHRHQFYSKENNTLFHDYIEYATPGGLLEPYINYFYVAKKLENIFSFRRQKLEDLFNHN